MNNALLRPAFDNENLKLKRLLSTCISEIDTLNKTQQLSKSLLTLVRKGQYESNNKESYKLIRLFLENGADVNYMESLLCWSVYHKDRDVAQMLLGYGASPDIYYPDLLYAASPIHMAIVDKDIDMTRILLQYRTKVNTPAPIRDVLIRRKFIALPENLNGMERYRLRRMKENKLKTSTKWIRVQNGNVSIDIQTIARKNGDKIFLTPLELAVISEGGLDMIDLLIASGALLDKRWLKDECLRYCTTDVKAMLYNHFTGVWSLQHWCRLAIRKRINVQYKLTNVLPLHLRNYLILH